MAQPAVLRMDHVYKKFRKGERHDSLRDLIPALAKRAVKRLSAPPQLRAEEFWALHDVSFEIHRGEAVGIIGHNGAGKSTMLKHLSGLIKPTRGHIEVRGSLSALIEVGAGFHPDLTGRENVFINGAILGMSRSEVQRKFDDIVAFSELGDFIDTPVKRYSSGMYVRLAFAVAAHLEPDILVVDEVLAVGDAEFQKKCMSKMQDVAGGMGRTVLFVSHNMVAVQSLCEKALLLERGRVKAAGTVASVVATYISQALESTYTATWDDPATAPGNSIMHILRISVSDNNVPGSTLLSMQTEIRIETEYRVHAANVLLHITYHLLNDQGITVLTSGNKPTVHLSGTYRAVCRVPANLLNSAGYSLKLFIVQNENLPIYEKEDVVSFNVIDTAERETAYMGREPGIVQPILEWSTEGPLDQMNRQEPAPALSANGVL